MTAPRGKGPRHPEVPTSDPLADLRADPAVMDDVLPALAPAEVFALESGGVFDQAWHDDAATAVVTAWHADTTSIRSLHRGGTCACRYLAQSALRTAVGVVLPVAVEGEGERDG